MPLREELERQGNWLFKRRSFLPLLLTGLFLLALRDFQYPHGSHTLDRIWEFICFSISISGLVLRAFTVGSVPRGTSGRNTATQMAYELNTTGMYSLLRHPLYLGNLIIWFGIVLLMRNWWLLAIVSLIWWMYYERIMFAEEEHLRQKFGAEYLRWAEKTPFMWPNFKRWEKPALSFSLRNGLRREYSGFFAIVAVFAVFDLVQESLVNNEFHIDPIWLWLLGASLVIYLTVLFLKKKTDFLVKWPR